jgi:hypothetical protein
MVAAAAGFHARWSATTALVLGIPLVALFTFVTPVVGSGNPNLSVPVPWLSVHSSAKEGALAVARQHLVWWGGVYFACLAFGLLSRLVRPVPSNAA